MARHVADSRFNSRRTKDRSAMTDDYVTPHVSEYIDDELKARGWTADNVYERLGYDRDDCKDFDRLMRQDLIVMSEKLAKGLAYVFAVDDTLFLNLHNRWRQESVPATSSKH